MAPSDHDRRILGLCLEQARLSRDPDTQVGAVLVSPEHQILSQGFNRFPDGVAYTHERLYNREMKMNLMIHAEMVAITEAARDGIRLKGSFLYLCATDNTGLIWGGAPCSSCTRHVIHCGIAKVVSYPFKPGPSKWANDILFAHSILEEAAVNFQSVQQPNTATA